MEILASVLAFFVVPATLFALAAAMAGFVCRPLQFLILLVGAVGVAVLCAGFAVAGMCAPLLIPLLAITYGLAAFASLWLVGRMEDDYRCEVMLAATREDERPPR